MRYNKNGQFSVISTHALREEGDPAGPDTLTNTWLFLPTPSARRATDGQRSSFGIRPISTHALREEGDGADGAPLGWCSKFLPTPSARRATESRIKAGATA